MSLTALAAKSFVIAWLAMPAAVDRSVSWPPPQQGITLSSEQKDAAMRPLVSSATECIARTVSADPRFHVVRPGVGFNELIVESVPRCVDVLRSMIDAYDRLYGEGAGETFFMGRYLDDLPEAVTRRVKDGQ